VVDETEEYVDRLEQIFEIDVAVRHIEDLGNSARHIDPYVGRSDIGESKVLLVATALY
jgi:hypothetical protein